nr:hypothetical protein [Micromonospora sp. DSM 115978]
VLTADFYAQGLDRADAYERVYTEVLPDPAVEDLLAGLPVDDSLVTANLRTVLPPSTLRGVAEAQIDDLVSYLRADTDDVAFTVDLRTVFDGVSGLANRYVADDLGDHETYQVDDLEQFTAGLVMTVDAVANGRPLPSLPDLDLSPAEVDLVLPVVLGRVPEAERDAVAAPLKAALLAGDVPGAIALVGDDLFAGDEQAVADLVDMLGGGSVLDVGVSLSDLQGDPAIDAVGQVHDVSAVLPWSTAGLGLLAAAGLAVSGWNARR